ncbi:hypothetical protein Saso_40500 [Streptomyces asoensis]|uniref:Secreted protein n=1 Tax=Streptomyces asoensis TaxID=249586 RepID=A0ABQ3S301_9ACTN|nr:hypothetical protein Saso_40500 [Streptomyces asoensis]
MICSIDSSISFARVPLRIASFAFSVSMDALSSTRIALTFLGRRTWIVQCPEYSRSTRIARFEQRLGEHSGTGRPGVSRTGP